MKNSILLYFALFLGTTACYNYETQFDGPYDGSEIIEDVALEKAVVYVAGGNVYLADRFVRDSIVIDNSGTVTIASINNAHTKVIFKQESKNIQIYDIALKTISGEVLDSEEAIWFDYHANNESIFFMEADGTLDTFGPEILATRPVDLKTHANIAGTVYVRGVTVLENGEFIYSILSASGFFNTWYLVRSNGDNAPVLREVPNYRKYLRLNQEEDALWATTESVDRLYSYRVPELSTIEDYFQYVFGAPIGTTSGYKITDDNEIYTPNFQTIASPGGEITAIDY